MLCCPALGGMRVDLGRARLHSRTDGFRSSFARLTGMLAWRCWVGTQFRVAEASQLPALTQLGEFDGFVIPGSRFNATDDEPWIEPLCETIRAAHAQGKALFGICFGHQVIAKALGGEAGAVLPYNFTVDDIELQPLASQLLGGRSTIALYKSHGQQVLAAPPGATVIARSMRTPIEMYTLDNVFCCQGHPEFVSTHTAARTSCHNSIIGGTATCKIANRLWMGPPE
jgi:GMP synthase-like glutamine amidotransferase